MIRRLGIVCWMALGLMMSAGSALAFGPINPNISSQTPDLVDVSFFGRPYPYGFTGWGPCVRYVEVETRWGPRLRRVWVCR
jgi:hypothetical protein